MKKMICLLMVFTYVLSMNMGAIAEENEETNEVHVMWIKKYANIVEMADDAELVVKGIVTETVLEAPKESPLLEKENEYILFLKQNTNLNSYYIIGAGQGVFDGEFIEDDLDYQEIIESLNLDFANKLSSLTYSARTIETPSSGNKWNKTNLTYDIGYHLYVDSAYLTAVGNGASSWNGIAGISLTEITSGDADIQIRYDVQGIDSICSYAVNTTSGTTITKSYINIYIYNGALTSTTRWKTLACHEVGHALGLSHYTGISASVMYHYIQDCSSSPQEADIIGLNDLY